MKSYETPFERISITRLVDSITANHMMLSFTDTCGIFLCLRGWAEVDINNRHVRIQAGDVFIYMPTMYVYVMGHSDDIEGITYKSTLDFVLPMVEGSFNIHDLLALTERPYLSLSERQMQHMRQLTDPETGQVNPMAEKMYDALCAACLKRPEGISDQDQMMVADIANMEILKQQLYEDIRTRGVVEDFRNGRQKLKRDNKSVQGVRMLMDQQRKHLAELRLTPNSRKAAQVPIDDGFEDF